MLGVAVYAREVAPASLRWVISGRGKRMEYQWNILTESVGVDDKLDSHQVIYLPQPSLNSVAVGPLPSVAEPRWPREVGQQIVCRHPFHRCERLRTAAARCVAQKMRGVLCPSSQQPYVRIYALSEDAGRTLPPPENLI